MKRAFIKTLIKFRYAFRGLAYCFKTQKSFRWHLASAALAIIAGLLLHISIDEWAMISLTIMLVLSTEAINTAIERVCDFVHKSHHKTIGLIKDISAGAVLILCIGAAIEGLIIFLPKLWSLYARIPWN